MSPRLAFAVLMLVFSLCTAVIPTSNGQIQQGWIEAWFSTENNLSLDYLRLSFVIHENDSILLLGSTQFQAIGVHPTLKIKIDSSGRFPTFVSGTATSDIAFAIVNSSRDYYVGDFANFALNATVDNGILESNLDLHNTVIDTMDSLFPNATIDNVGIRGRITFEIIIRNSVGLVGQKRFLRTSLQGIANLGVAICDFSIPTTADLIDAKNGDQDMQKSGVPYRVDTNVVINPLEPINGNLYIEWQVPAEVPLPMIYPYNFLISIAISLVAGWIGRYIYDNVRLKRQQQKTAPVLKALLQRIDEHCRLLVTWVTVIAFEKHDVSSEVLDRIKESKDALCPI